MIDKLIQNYLQTLTINDIIKFANTKNINITSNEASIIYDCITNNWYELIHKNPDNIFNNLKNNLSKETYNNCLLLYNEYKSKYYL